MLKKFQNYLLLHHPLLWNTRLPLVVLPIILLHIIFFIIGYSDGAIDFAPDETDYVYDIIPGIVIFFNILLSTLVFIIWLVYYLRNNAFKSFYPLKNNSLYKEWLLIFIICILNCSYSASYLYAKDAKARSYFTEKEAFNRMEIISMASYFADGPNLIQDSKTVEKNGVISTVKIDSFTFKNKKYGVRSLMNKSISLFYHTNNAHKDSLNNIRIKNWLYANRKDSVLQLMQKLDVIAKSHNLKSNISPKQWLDMVYDYPDFNTYRIIGKTDKYPGNTYYDNSVGYAAPVNAETGVMMPDTVPRVSDTVNNTIRIINNQEYIYPKYYVPLMHLKNGYGQISKAYINPELDLDTFFIYVYFALAASLLVFSFRVTSGKSWLIAGVALGITGILSGIFSLIVSSELLYYILWIIITILLIVHFIIINKQRKSKGLTTVTLNTILWLLPALVPLVFYSFRYYYTIYIYYETVDYSRLPPHDIHWTQTWESYILYINLAFVIIYMYFLTVQIKKWKGIAED